MLASASPVLSSPFFHCDHAQIPLAANVRHVSDMSELQRACSGLVRAAQQVGQRVPSNTASLLDLLIEATDEEATASVGSSGPRSGAKLSDRELIDNTLTFLVAGKWCHMRHNLSACFFP
jgi:cytochrome P450